MSPFGEKGTDTIIASFPAKSSARAAGLCGRRPWHRKPLAFWPRRMRRCLPPPARLGRIGHATAPRMTVNRIPPITVNPAFLRNMPPARRWRSWRASGNPAVKQGVQVACDSVHLETKTPQAEAGGQAWGCLFLNHFASLAFGLRLNRFSRTGHWFAAVLAGVNRQFAVTSRTSLRSSSFRPFPACRTCWARSSRTSGRCWGCPASGPRPC